MINCGVFNKLVILQNIADIKSLAKRLYATSCECSNSQGELGLNSKNSFRLKVNRQ